MKKHPKYTCFSIFILYVISGVIFASWFIYIVSWHILADIIIIGSILYLLHIKKKIDNEFKEIIINLEDLFINSSNPTGYIKFNNYARRVFKRNLFKLKSLSTYGFPLLYVIFISLYFYISVLRGKIKFGNTVININAENILYFFIFIISLFLVGLILINLTIKTSTLGVQVYNTIKKLGKGEYKIEITYPDLKLGTIQDLGNFLFSIGFPPILMSAIFWGIGLLYLIQFNNPIIGLVFTIVGPIILSFIIPLFYKNLKQIHREIMKYKIIQKKRVINQIKDSKATTLNFQDFYYIHNYYDNTIDKINNWPIKLKSIYAAGLAISSLILQFISIYIGCLTFF